ncbi:MULTISPECIES: GDP-L-fucose synthase [unclassified Labrenzia]|uniref:GDP-L-fucose synthase family protein n=1 Tax=unclassified Labrenzia TaxID=2648686 RepID=UPI0004B4183D|nr:MULTISPECIES: GDP-L-fucose synthase [unclassified Labrenzia]
MPRVLLTGGSGMVGKNLLAHERPDNLEFIAPDSSKLNLLDFYQTEAFLKREKPDIIVHAAGVVGGIQANIASPVRFLTDNWNMGSNLITAARSAGVPQLLNIGSSCMYPKDQDTPLKEAQVLSASLEPTNEGYALAKCAVARLCEYIVRETPEFQYKTIIPCNLYGRFDKFDPAVSHLVPAVIRKIHQATVAKNKTVEIWGTGEARREFMFAEDLADAVVFFLGKFEKLPNVANVGVGKDFTINEYYEITSNVIGYSGKFTHDLTKPVGMKRKLLDVSLQSEMGWKPKTSLNDGIRQTYEYFLSLGE